MYGFWGIVLLIGIANRLFAYLVRSRISARKPQNDTEAINRLRISKSSSLDRWFQSHIILPAAFGYRHQQPWGWCTIPTRIQSLIVFAYVLLNILACAIGNYGGFEGNILYFFPLFFHIKKKKKKIIKGKSLLHKLTTFEIVILTLSNKRGPTSQIAPDGSP